MGIPQVFLLSQACLYMLLFVLSFFVCVPVGVNLGNFNSNCLLYATGEWNLTVLQKVDWGPSSACNFTVFIGVVSLLLSLFCLIRISVSLAKNVESSWIDAFVNFVLNFVICLCTFSSAMTVSIGFQDWCKIVVDPKSGIKSCEDGQYGTLGDKIKVNANSYYIQWQMAQFGIWSCWLCWLTLTVMSLIRIYRYHQRESFFKSISREKQRLLAHVGKSQEQS